MQLKTIKLLGFKSFVDQQILELPSRITAIVGPNGCGKSNVIDAVKWVIGESQAKQLRGDQMTDVIFNGSAQRKPVGQAHVELTFDNSSEILKGPFSHYSEVTVKRVIGRDANSLYSINQTRCRRKDVIDLFTGTGLGPRSYAIIEQGMINRFIEAKPADLRGYLEEAAGISRYFEKRKETLAHLEETIENLNRIKDLEDEIQKRCQVLSQQAEEAALYQRLREECVLFKQQYLSAMYRSSQAEYESLTQQIQDRTESLQKLELEYVRAQKSVFELEKSRDDDQENYNYHKDALHQKIQRRQQLQHQLDQVRLQMEWLGSKIKESQEAQSQLKQTILGLEAWFAEHGDRSSQSDGQLDLIEGRLLQSLENVKIAEGQVQKAEGAVKDLHAKSHEEKREFDALALQCKNNAQHLAHKKDSLRNLDKDKESLQKKYEECDVMSHEVALATLYTDKEESEKSLKNAQKDSGQCLEILQSDQTEKAVLEHELKTMRHRKMECDQKIQAYQKTTSSWLNPAQKAQPVTIQTWGEVSSSGEYLRATPTQFFYHGIQPVTAAQLQVQADLDLEYTWGESRPEYWYSYIVKSNIQEALESLDQLKDNQAYLLPNGALLGKNWTRPWRQRAPILAQLLEESKSLEHRIQESAERLFIIVERIRNTQIKKQNSDQVIQKESRALETIQQKIQKHLLEIERLKQAQKDLLERKKFNETQIQQTLQTIERVDAELIAFEDKKSIVLKKIELHQEDILNAENHSKEMKQFYQNALKAKEEILLQKHEYIRASDMQKMQYEQNQSKYQNSQSLYAEHEKNLIKYEQDLAVRAQQKQVEQAAIDEEDPQIATHQKELQSLQEAVQATIGALQKAQALLKEHEKSLAKENHAIQQSRTSLEKVIFQQTYLNEQILDQGWIKEQIILVLTELSISDLKKKISQYEEQLRDLGAVNLKALQEYEAQLQRHKEYVSQRLDLESAMNELNHAVALLDVDMKNLFETTFAQLKSHFETLFPVLFAGGFGTITLEADASSGENGIVIHAQPPGKKNTRLSILSGGEKALTAAALVFSFFQLNPAPFCLLDEIDAPLDDANTQRLGAMIASLKDRIQFIVVTHSKVMMEYADSLYGVTMKEPGVSKFVSVNLVEAMEAIAEKVD